jgi:hypothetical protein
MIRQAFTEENFRKIFDYENRKGNFLEGRFFPLLQKDTDILKDVSASFRELKSKRSNIPQASYEAEQEKLNQAKDQAKERKEKNLSKALQEISETILHDDFKIELKKLPLPTGKMAYCPDKTCPISYFAIKQVQNNIRSIYKVKQENRSHIISQLIALLGDTLQKWVIRLDIKGFYENIPHNHLIATMNKDSILSYTSRKIIQKILNEYSRISLSSIGIPRGVGISAYLSELFMRKFDETIAHIDNIIYYARYVDDIILIVSPQYRKNINDVVSDVENKLGKIGLQLNRTKLTCCDLSSVRMANFEYLGYKIAFGNGDVLLEISAKKIRKYQDRIDITIREFEKRCSIDYKRAANILYKRIKFLTGNTRLWNNKRYILTGIFFSNQHLTEKSCLTGLDRYLEHKITSHPKIRVELKNKLKPLRFYQGFCDRRFSLFSVAELSKITKVWKNVA